MPTCPAGHQTANTDFCDTCGLPVPATAAPPADTAAPAEVKTLQCPNCHAENLPQALFCESCGCDFETNQVPDNLWAKSPDAEPSADAAPAPEQPAPEQPAPEQPAADAPAAPEAEHVEVNWVAELWIDPDWYELQGSPDPLPSAGLPDIIPLVRPSNLIGRTSVSREIYPQIDCELDTGVSRRHAMLTTDQTRWWVEDLDSANGTFVGDPAGPLPSMPIPRGRVELSSGQRVYVGAWTRIVVRPATDDEKQTLTA